MSAPKINYQIHEYKWIGFDLDETLHYFKKSSFKAIEEVYRYINEEFGIEISKQKSAYKEILIKAQNNNFIEDKSSHEYRAERFTKLLSIFSILPHIHVERLLKIYQKSLEINLEPKEGALQLLKACKDQTYKVCVITEGPEDAQKLVLEKLGFLPYVDILITSTKEGLIKKNGLMKKSLKILECKPYEMLFIGDMLEKDIFPCQKLGIPCVFFPNEYTVQDLEHDIPTITSLNELHEYI